MKVKLSILIALLLAGFETSSAEPNSAVIGWGNLDFGEYGFVSGFRSNGIVAIGSQVLTNAVAISAGGLFSLALTDEGKVVRWGEINQPPSPFPGTNGVVVMDGSPLSNVKAIACGYDHSLALKEDGTVVAWDGGLDIKRKKSLETQVPRELKHVKAIAAGFRRSLAVKGDGMVEVWGKGQSPSGEANQVVAIAAGSGIHGRHDVALREDGSVVTWDVGGISDPPLQQPKGMSNIVAIAAGTAHVLALQDNGTVWGWGFNSKGAATGVPTPKGAKMAAGIVHIDGKPLTDVKAIAAGMESSLALKKDGTLVFWGDDHRGLLRPPPDINGVIAIALSGSHALAITTNMALISREPRSGQP
jgi:Alpha-tubulin suppressor and related RCC1 domain-containing proteins